MKAPGLFIIYIKDDNKLFFEVKINIIIADDIPLNIFKTTVDFVCRYKMNKRKGSDDAGSDTLTRILRVS